MPLGSLNTDLVWKNSTENTANFQDPGNFVKSHLMISQVQHQKSCSKNATSVAFFPSHIPTHRVASLPCACLDLVLHIPLQRQQLLDWECCYYYIITNLFLLGDAWGFWEDSRYNISLGILRLFMYRALSNTICWYFREGLLISLQVF